MKKTENFKTPTAALRPVGGLSLENKTQGIRKSTDALIGATRVEQQTITEWVWECVPPVVIPQQNKSVSNPYEWLECTGDDVAQLVQHTRTVNVTITTESDGMAIKTSAVALPGVQQNCILKAEGVNHEELKNHDVMFDKFDRIFNAEVGYRDDRYPQFFYVPAR
jgi:hypothetical protein